LDKVKRACVVNKEVGMTELEANIDARKFRTVNGVGGGEEVSTLLTWVSVARWFAAAPSGEEPPFFGAVSVDNFLPSPSENTFHGGVG
jgi:hypothetical protein